MRDSFDSYLGRFMQIDYEQLDNGILKINLSGRMDIAGSQQIDRKLAELTAPPSRAVVVDLAKVGFLASAGIRMLLINAKALQSRGGKMVLLNPEASVAKVLELSGLDVTIGVFRDLKAACAALTGAAPRGA